MVEIVCSFCNKDKAQVDKIVAGDGVYICDECIDICFKEIHKLMPIVIDPPKIEHDVDKLTPHKIKEFLDQYVIGQDYAKTVISVAVHNHYKRIDDKNEDGVELEKSNILMIGSPGVGKTLVARTIAKLLDVPFAICDATTLTEYGYVGSDPDSMIIDLLASAGGDVKKAERGIVYLDEIEKKARKSENMSITRDVSGEGVQQALLKLIEGTECRISPQGGRKHPNQETVVVNTRNILFILGGSFTGIDKIVEARVDKTTSIGFGASLKVAENRMNGFDLLRKLEPEDFIKYGLIPELVGRISVYAPLDELDENQLIQVLTEPKNAIIKQFSKIFNLENVELIFTEEALMNVARLAKDRKIGARGLRSVIEQKLIQTQFDLPDLYQTGIRKVIFDKENILTDLPPTLIRKEAA